MIDKYNEWIRNYLSTLSHTQECLGKCHEVSVRMQADFPELRLVRGHVETGTWGTRAHWWLETEDGQIVDPTKTQFPMIFSYEEFIEGVTEYRIGKCMNCGDEIWGVSIESVYGTCICSEECAKDFM